jgi:transcriptional regulator with XRE-family HTH domain
VRQESAENSLFPQKPQIPHRVNDHSHRLPPFPESGRPAIIFPGITDCENHEISEYWGQPACIAPTEVTMAGYQTVAQRNLTCAIRIRERRRQVGLTQTELVDLVNEHGSRLSSQGLSAIENGRRLAVGRLPDLAAALQCTVSYLLGLTADPYRWEPDDASAPALLSPAAPPASASRAARPAPASRTALPASAPAGQAAANGAANQGAAPRHGWILGPDVPDAVPARQRSS